jgi:hypothetical protein
MARSSVRNGVVSILHEQRNAFVSETSTTTLDRMVRAVEKVRERLLKSTAALERAEIPYAVVGGNAVAAWVARVDEAAVRNTRDVNLLVRRDDFPAIRVALESEGFVYGHARGIDMFLDGPGAKARDAVHLLFAAEKVRQEDALPVADLHEVERFEQFNVVPFEALVRMKLTSYRLKDQVHLQDMISVEMIDETWPARLPAPLDERLQALLDDPDA